MKRLLFALSCLLLANLSVQAGQMSLLGAGGVTAGGGGGFALAYQSSVALLDTTNLTVDYGTLTYAAGADRVICVILKNANDASSVSTVTAVTIGGVALAQVSGAAIDRGSADVGADVWESTGPLSGTSGDVQVTYFSTLNWSSSVALYNLTTTTPTASATASVKTASPTTSLATTIAVPSGGGAIIASCTGGGATETFTGATVDDSKLDHTVTFYYGHATSTGSDTVTATFTSDNAVIAAVAWGP